MTMLRRIIERGRPWLWRWAQALHHVDFAWVLPAMARLPLAWGYRLAKWRGRLNARTGRDWRSMALGMRHIQRQALAGYRSLPMQADDAQCLLWSRERFVVEARDEFEARLTAAGRLAALRCRHVFPPGGSFAGVAPKRERGLLLLTPHFDSFFLGVAFAARGGAKVNLMSSAVTQDARVDAAVRQHFSAKYRGLEPYLNGGRVLDMEEGIRPFYRMLEQGEALVVLGDAPVLPQGVATQVDFLGASRLLAGGALRMAQKADCDLVGYICRMERPGEYVMEWCEPGPARDPETVRRVYALFTQAIEQSPGHWWASDLLPAMPPCPPKAPAYRVLAFTDSPLEGSAELDFGLKALQRQWPGATRGAGACWHTERRDAAPALAAFLDDADASHLLVVLEPAVLGTADVPALLAQCLDACDNAVCAVAEDARFAAGEWAADYITQADFERYAARRAKLPAHATMRALEPAERPLVYMLSLDRLRARSAPPPLDWDELPQALGSATVLAPRAFVHGYAGYQQGSRPEMLDMLPAGVQRLLDVGGGEGGFARAFLAQRGGTALLVEPSQQAARRAREHGLEVFAGPMEQLDPESVAHFDAVSFLDVLEHLEEPLPALRQARQLLAPGGVVLISVPNVGYWSVVRDLANGRFDYLPVGILCRTHLRFFTQRNLEQLLADAGFELVSLRRHTPPPSAEQRQFVQALETAGLPCDHDSLATESLHALARMR